MSQFYAKDGRFWLDDRPQLIQAGEFHYFRTPKDQWPHRLELLKRAGFNTVATYIPWLWHQPQPGISDLDGHTHPMRDLAGFLDLAADMGFLLIPRPGPYIMAETINEGIPPWVFQNFPQVAYLDPRGAAQNVVSYLHPDFLACVARWYRAVFAVLTPRQITRGGKIILIQLDNEMGMIQWVRNIMDTHPDTLARFAAHLRQVYGAGLAGRYPTGQLEAVLRQGITDPAAPQADQVVADYRRFYRAYLGDYAAHLWAEARANGLEVPPVINIHGFGNGGKTFPIGLSQLVEVLRMAGVISATDVYPIHIGEGNIHELLLVNAMTAALQNREQPLFSMEFQAGGNADFSNTQSSFYDLHTRLSLSIGLRGINHYLFCDGENDPVLSPVRRHDWGHPVRKDGTVRTHYARYGKLSRVLAAYGPALTLAQPRTVTTVGFLLDQFMTEVNHEATQEATRILTHQRDVILFDFIARGLTLTHRPFDALDLDRGDLHPTRTPVCWALMDKQCRAETQQRLADYVRQGGRLILAGRMCVEDFDHVACTILKDAIGIRQMHAEAPFVSTVIRAFNQDHIPVSFLETYTGDFDEVFATREPGEVAGFIKRVGAGEVMLLGAALAANTLADLAIVEQMAARMGVLPQFELSEWADVRLSEGEQGSFLFINNYRDDPVAPTIAQEGRPLFGGHPVQLAARTGAILPLEWRVAEGITLHYLTSEVTGVTATDAEITIMTAQNDFHAELTLCGYGCEEPTGVADAGAPVRLRLHGGLGRIVLRKLISA